MDIGNLFVEQKWNILKCLVDNKMSPLELAKKSNTSIANISQQLRLLETANIVKKEKVSNRDKGKPRTLFSLKKDYAYMVSTIKNLAYKKLIDVTVHHEVILRIWFLDNPKLHYSLAKFYWYIEPYIDEISFFGITQDNDSYHLIIASDNIAAIKNMLAAKNSEISSDYKGYQIHLLKNNDFSSYINGKQSRNLPQKEEIFALYDPLHSTISKVFGREDNQINGKNVAT